MSPGSSTENSHHRHDGSLSPWQPRNFSRRQAAVPSSTLSRRIRIALALPFLACALPLFAAETIFVGDPEKTVNNGDLSGAFNQLAETGGTIVLRGAVRISGDFKTPAHKAPVTLTDRHKGKDYRKQNGAKLILDGNFTANGPTNLASLLILADNKSPHFFCKGQAFVFGKDLSCRKSSAGTFPSIVGAADKTGSNITIDGGEWDTVSGGALQSSPQTNGTLRVTVNGGIFHGTVRAIGAGRHTGDAEMTLNQGIFYGGVAALDGDAKASAQGAVKITINGGTFHNTIAASRGADAKFAGSYTLAIKGGDFVSVTDVTGTRGLRGGATSSLAAPAALLDAENKGELTFTNPLIRGADPWIFLHKGYYHCISTGGSQLTGRKVANLPDLPHAAPVVYWKPEPKKPWSKNLWSPKIYHFSEAEMGEKNAGWYLYLTANDGSDNSAHGHRLYVLRGLGDDPFGRYGSPLDGKADTPVRVGSLDQRMFQNEWIAGPKVLKFRGKNYLIWVSRRGDRNSKKTGDHLQFIAIDELINPWTTAGKPAIICRPTHDWEKRGAGPRTVEGERRMYPEVVEGGTPVIAADGSLYLLYAASGYWTPYYAIGLLKLVGDDPMNPSHWAKATRPIFKASDEIVGTGNACYIPSPTGKTSWAVYHAYVGRKTGRGAYRQLFAEPYLATDKYVTIGTGQPLPLGTPLTIEANPMPLRKKIDNFTEPLPNTTHVGASLDDARDATTSRPSAPMRSQNCIRGHAQARPLQDPPKTPPSSKSPSQT